MCLIWRVSRGQEARKGHGEDGGEEKKVEGNRIHDMKGGDLEQDKAG